MAFGSVIYKAAGWCNSMTHRLLTRVWAAQHSSKKDICLFCTTLDSSVYSYSHRLFPSETRKASINKMQKATPMARSTDINSQTNFFRTTGRNCFYISNSYHSRQQQLNKSFLHLWMLTAGAEGSEQRGLSVHTLPGDPACSTARSFWPPATRPVPAGTVHQLTRGCASERKPESTDSLLFF